MDNFNDELKKILIKKAKGFYYTEETIEFTENSNGKKVGVTVNQSRVNITGIKRKRGRPRKNLAESVTYFNETQKSGVDLTQKEGEDASKQETTVVKRKITTHYVPPDMLAIKMLFENFGEKVDGLEDMSDEELINLKRKLMLEWEEENANKSN